MLSYTDFSSLNVTWEDKRRLSLRQKARAKLQRQQEQDPNDQPQCSSHNISSTSSLPQSDKDSASDDSAGGIICAEGRRLSELSYDSVSSFGDRSSICESDSSVFHSNSDVSGATGGAHVEQQSEVLKNRLIVAQRVSIYKGYICNQISCLVTDKVH